MARGASASVRDWSGVLYRWRWVIGAVGVLVVALAVVHWARARPGYDPYGWLVWGHLTIHGKLDTNGAPSWKPLPFLFTVPYALTGVHALTLWMVTAVAASLAGVIFAWRVAFTLVDAPPEHRYAAYLAGLVAGLALLGIDGYLHTILSAESDTIITTLCLAAIDCMLQRRHRWAFWMWWLAALGRPEVWPVLALFVAWAWRSQPAMRRQMVAGVALAPVLWFGIPAVTSKSAFTAGSLAERSPRQLHGDKITGTLDRFSGLDAVSVRLAAALAVVRALLRRDRLVVLVAGFTGLWLAIEVAFALHGWPAVPRYMYEAAGTTCVLAGVFAGRVVLDAPRALRWLADRLPVRGTTWLAAPATGGVVAAIVIVAFAASVGHTARHRLVDERHDLALQRERTHQIAQLRQAITAVSGARVLACGTPNIPIAFQSILAWDLGTNTGELYVSARHEREHPIPLENIYPHSYGWQLFPSNWTTPAQRAACRGLLYRTPA